MVLYQYFIEVVPTDVQTVLHHTYTYQYSVKDHLRVIDHYKGMWVHVYFSHQFNKFFLIIIFPRLHYY